MKTLTSFSAGGAGQSCGESQGRAAQGRFEPIF